MKLIKRMVTGVAYMLTIHVLAIALLTYIGLPYLLHGGAEQLQARLVEVHYGYWIVWVITSLIAAESIGRYYE